MKHSKTILLFCIYMLKSLLLSAQNVQSNFTPKLGDTLPEYIFTDLRNYSKNSLSLSELRGKWLIIDFWSKDCSGCLKSFPKMNKLHEKFNDQVTVLMIGTIGKYSLPSGKTIEREQATKDIYNRLEKLYNLKLPVAFDASLESAYNIRSLPYILVIDPNGIIRGITYSVNDEIISSFLSGANPTLRPAYTGTELDEFDKIYKQSSLLYAEELPDDLTKELNLVRSTLSLYDRSVMPMKGSIDLNNINNTTTSKALNEGILETSRIGIQNLFYTAFFGVTSWHSDKPEYYNRFSKHFVFETPDSLKFDNKDKTEYAYSLTVPQSKANIQYLKKIMQKDLEAYFGLKGRVEKRPMPVYYLVIKDKKKAKILISEGNKDRYRKDPKLPKANQIVLNNSTMLKLCQMIGGFTGVSSPIIDNTGFESKIDIDLRAYIYDLKEIEKALSRYGLAIENGTKEFETIVISNSKDFLQ